MCCPATERVARAQLRPWPPSGSVYPRHFLLHRKQHPSQREAVGCVQTQRSRGRGGLGKQLSALTWTRVVSSRLPRRLASGRMQRRRSRGSGQGPAGDWHQDASGKSLAATEQVSLSAAEQVSLSRKSFAGADLEGYFPRGFPQAAAMSSIGCAAQM
jgi:hypothetical protein